MAFILPRPNGLWLLLTVDSLYKIDLSNGVDFLNFISASLVSDAVRIRGVPWKILATFHKKCLGLYLQCNAGNRDKNWSCAGSVTGRILAQKEDKEDHLWKIAHIFHAEENNWGGNKLMTFEELLDPENGWYDKENDTVILSADVTADVPRGIKHLASLANQLMDLLSSGKGTDVDFLVENGDGEKEKFAAHKLILATISDVFYKMFDFDSECGNSDKVIKVTDVKPEVFGLMLNFIYTTNLDGLNRENMFDVLHAAKKYNITDLVDACADYYPTLETNNVLYVLRMALRYEEKDLVKRCWEFIDQNASAVLESDNFVEMDQELLCDLFARDQLVLHPGEIAIWNATLRWADAECHKRNMELTGDNRRMVLGPALFNIRIPLIQKKLFLKSIVPTKVLTEKEVLCIYFYHDHPKNDIPSEYTTEFSSKSRASK